MKSFNQFIIEKTDQRMQPDRLSHMDLSNISTLKEYLSQHHLMGQSLKELGHGGFGIVYQINSGASFENNVLKISRLREAIELNSEQEKYTVKELIDGYGIFVQNIFEINKADPYFYMNSYFPRIKSFNVIIDVNKETSAKQLNIKLATQIEKLIPHSSSKVNVHTLSLCVQKLIEKGPEGSKTDYLSSAFFIAMEQSFPSLALIDNKEQRQKECLLKLLVEFILTKLGKQHLTTEALALGKTSQQQQQKQQKIEKKRESIQWLTQFLVQAKIEDEQFIDFIDIVKPLFEKNTQGQVMYFNDIKAGNLMFRRSQYGFELVITDPLM